MQQDRLFRLAPEALTLHAHYVGGSGWQLRVAVRAQGDQWSDEAWVHYDHLTTQELLDTIEGDLSSRL
jgi:hypothetical protein